MGDVEFIKGDCSEVHIQGSCGNVSTMSGDVTCADVNGDIKLCRVMLSVVMLQGILKL